MDSVGYRQDEHLFINQLLVAHAETPNSKPEALLLLYLFRAELTQELQHEVRKMLPLVLKLVHSLVDIISSLGFLKPIVLTMQLCQMLVQGMWLDDSSLIQIMDKKSAVLL